MDNTGAVVPPHISMANQVLYGRARRLALVFDLPCALAWNLDSGLLLGVLTALLPMLSILKAPGALFTRMMVAAATDDLLRPQHRSGPRLGSNCTLGYSCYWRCWSFTRTGESSCGAAAVIAVHHLLFNYLQAAHYQVWVFTSPDLTMVFVHAAYVVVETVASAISPPY